MSLLGSIFAQISLTNIIDIGITALLIYWLFSLIRGTRAVRLVIGVSVLVLVYALAVAFDLRLLTQILQTGAVVGLFALVVDLPAGAPARARADRPGRLVRLAALARRDARRRARLDRGRTSRRTAVRADGQGALIVLQRETGLEEVAETGVMIHGDVSADLLCTIFTPKSPLHDGAVIVREERIVAAGALLPLAETSIHTERFGTRHRAALGITEQTDAVVVVVSEENGQISLVERARIVRNLTEAGLSRAIQGLLDPAGGRRGAFGWRSAAQVADLGGDRRGCASSAASWADRTVQATPQATAAPARRPPPPAPAADTPPAADPAPAPSVTSEREPESETDATAPSADTPTTGRRRARSTLIAGDRRR